MNLSLTKHLNYPVHHSIFASKIYIPAYGIPISIEQLPDLNNELDVQMDITKKYYNLVIYKWLHDDFLELLNYINLSNGKVSFLNSANDYKIYDEKSNSNIERKINFLIESDIINKKIMHKILTKFDNKYNIEWIKFHENVDLIKKFTKKYLKNKIIKKINND
jgi:hypothetical protein